MSRRAALKIDVCTREGFRTRAPRVLDALKRAGVRASFFLAFGPDCSGWAIRRVLDPKFRRKMARSGAASLYGWRTVLSGTLLPARPVGAGFPDLVRRIAAEGHEVALHGWNHRLWQDRVRTMDEAAAFEQLARAADAFERILGRRPAASGAPGWIVSAASLRAQERLHLSYASDLRGGPACRLALAGESFSTPQFPTTTLCIEELLADGPRPREALRDALLAALAPAAAPPTGAVLPIHAEVEGGPYLDVFEGLLARARELGTEFVPLAELAAAAPDAALPRRELALVELPGRADPVVSSIASGSQRVGREAAEE